MKKKAITFVFSQIKANWTSKTYSRDFFAGHCSRCFEDIKVKSKKNPTPLVFLVTSFSDVIPFADQICSMCVYDHVEILFCTDKFSHCLHLFTFQVKLRRCHFFNREKYQWKCDFSQKILFRPLGPINF